MDTTLNPKQTDPRPVLLARADEELAHAYEQITRAAEQIARAEEQLSRLEHDAVPGNRPLLDRPAVRGLTGLLLAACISVAAIAWQSSYGDAAKEIIARWAPKQIDEALRQQHSNKILLMIAMATKAADETSAAIEKLSNEAEPVLSKDINLSTASRSDLEDLRRDLKAAEAKAATLLPRAIALIRAERDRVEAFALSLHAGKDIVGRFLDDVDKRHAETTALTSRTLSARADYYRAYEGYVAIPAGEFGVYKVVNGQFIFPLQRTVDRYNAAAQAMTVAAKRVAELQEERRQLMQSQQQAWEQFVDSQ
jgi:hypothetical protein